jgi:uncharacterized membrane protein YoaK (UPF0700 family)
MAGAEAGAGRTSQAAAAGSAEAPRVPPGHAPALAPLPALVPILLVLTFVTGLVDAISYLKLGHVFVANMTGNVVFLGLALADPRDFSMAASILALATFLLGALAGGRLGSAMGQQRARLLAVAITVEIALVALALALSVALPLQAGQAPGDAVRTFALIAPLAVAMGLQNAVARRLAVPDLTTTVLTLTLTGLAADSTLAGGEGPRPARRLLATATMFLGAAVGAGIILQVGLAAGLMLALTVLVGSGIASFRIKVTPAAGSAAAPVIARSSSQSRDR